MPQQPVFVLQQDLKSSRGLHEEMKKAASNNAKQVKHTSVYCVLRGPELMKMTNYNYIVWSYLFL